MLANVLLDSSSEVTVISEALMEDMRAGIPRVKLAYPFDGSSSGGYGFPRTMQCSRSELR